MFCIKLNYFSQPKYNDT